jgi:chromosome segregation ATPase
MTRYLEIKPGSISETIKRLSDDYQAIFKKELEKTGKGIGSMTPDEKKAFFNKIDKMHNAKNEAMDSSWIKKEIDKEKKTTLVAAPGNKEKVIRIPKEKLADYKAKGYVEAESYIPEAKKVKEEELTAGQKKLPPALQKAIEKKDKKEEVEITETEGGSGGGIDALRAIKGKRLRLQGELDALNKDDPNYKEKKAAKQKEIEAQKEIMARKQREVYGSFDPSIEDALDLYEGGFKDIDVRKGDLKLAKDKKENLKNKYNAIMANQAQGDENAIADQIQKLDMSIKKQEQELIDIMKKGKEGQKNEAVDPERVQKLNQKIASMTTKMGELDRSKPETKTKEAIMKSDIATAKLRLQDLMQKGASAVKKAVNEASKAKQSYKTLKMSLKKEQEINNKKKTLTDKPITKIEVNPKIEN